jgi:hypothetical protein
MEAVGLPDGDARVFSDNPASPPPPKAPTCRRTLVYPLIIHVLEVVDRLPINSDMPLVSEDEDTIRRHVYPWWGGRVDGSGRGAVRGGGHAFADAGSDHRGGGGGRRDRARAFTVQDPVGGGWGRNRSHGLFRPAGGIPEPRRPSRASPQGRPSSPVAVVSPSTPSAASTVTGSAVWTCTPASPKSHSVASTATRAQRC